ncbi:MAG: hypothetical protein CMB80_24565 [Flammeovirgaceae bacterium]|nr:hypothetical protein [Flammeovirgaceae bacterium]
MQEASTAMTHPAGYKELEVGYAVGMVTKPSNDVDFYQITNKESVPIIHKTASGWYTLATSSTNAIGDISDFLEPADGVLYVLKFGVHSHPDILDIKVSVPAATERFGIKNAQTMRVNGMNSPAHNPNVVLYCWGTSFVPNFTIENNTNTPFTSSVGYLKFTFSGHKYQMEAVKGEPATAHIVNLLGINE